MTLNTHASDDKIIMIANEGQMAHLYSSFVPTHSAAGETGGAAIQQPCDFHIELELPMWSSVLGSSIFQPTRSGQMQVCAILHTAKVQKPGYPVIRNTNLGVSG